jgi:hypothetical protein
VQTLRALVLATVASGAATLAHAVGGGHLVSGTGVLVGTALLTGATLPFVRSGLSAVRAAVLLGSLQVAAHVVHGLSAMAAGAPVHGGGATVPSHAAHGIRPLGRIDTGAGTADARGAVATSALTDLLPTPTMLLAHVVAAVAVGVVLARGEQSWRVACALLAVVGVAMTRVVRALTHGALALWRAVTESRASLAGLACTPPSEGIVPTDVWRAGAPVRRGPPALLLT